MTIQDTSSPDRRQFLTVVLAATAGSVATGSALALLKGVDPRPEVIPSTPVVPAARESLPVTTTAVDGDLLARLAATQAENVRLQAALSAAERRLEIAEQGRLDAGSDTELLRAELASSQEQMGLLAGLVALYEKLDDADLGEVVSRGINDVAGHLAGLALDLPRLAEGLLEGERALDLFEADIPALESGRAWLGEQLGRLALAWELVDEALRDVLEAVGPVLEMIQNWFNKVLGWVPFEWGARASRVMNALFGLMEETPRTIEGGQRELLVSLDSWFKAEAGQKEPAVRTRLLNPVRERTIGSARRTADQVKQVQESFQQDLVARTATAVADRQEIKRQITRYRQENGL